MTTVYDLTQLEDPAWEPVDRAVLLFVIQGDRILLIHKKRGLGAGKINGPGGRIEPGESPLEAAIRETEEELLIRPGAVHQAGELRFQFLDGYSLHCTVFTADGFEGTPTETGEAVPHWFPLEAIPYDRMWADDRIWIPLMLAGKPFHGKFLFDGDTMLGQEMTLR